MNAAGRAGPEEVKEICEEDAMAVYGAKSLQKAGGSDYVLFDVVTAAAEEGKNKGLRGKELKEFVEKTFLDNV